MSRERLYLFDTTLRGPFARSRVAGEHEPTEKSRRADGGQGQND